MQRHLLDCFEELLSFNSNNWHLVCFPRYAYKCIYHTVFRARCGRSRMRDMPHRHTPPHSDAAPRRSILHLLSVAGVGGLRCLPLLRRRAAGLGHDQLGRKAAPMCDDQQQLTVRQPM